MFNRPVPQDPPAAACCEVFPASALRVRAGVNAGDDLGAAWAPCAGDIYRLDGDVRPALVRFTAPAGPDGRHRFGSGSDIAMAGNPVTVGARLMFMTMDGTRTDVLLLRPGPQGRSDAAAVLLPLQPLIPGADHILIRIDSLPVPFRLPDMACGMLGRDSRIMMADGAQRPAAALRPGDLILTRDHGAQPLRWAGLVTVRAAGALAPVVIARGTLGNGDALILGQHSRLFLYHRNEATRPAPCETLVEARHLLDTPGITLRAGGLVDHALLVFDRHEIIYAEGIAVESLQVTDATVDRLPEDIGAAVRARFPGLNQPLHHGTEAGQSPARPARQAWGL